MRPPRAPEAGPPKRRDAGMSGEGGDGDGEGEGNTGLGGTLGGLVAAVVIVALGLWLVVEMTDTARYSDCAASRRRNCDSIEYRRAAPP